MNFLCKLKKIQSGTAPTTCTVGVPSVSDNQAVVFGIRHSKMIFENN